MARVLIAGCGYVGERLGQRLLHSRHSVHCARRDASSLGAALRPISADLCDEHAVDRLPFPFETIVYTVAADESTPEAYRRAYVEGPLRLLRRASREAIPTRFLFASSTSVYGEDAGSWVDETTQPYPAGFRGEILIEAEETIRHETAQSACIRFGGIYGPGRTHLIEAARAASPSYDIETDRFTNRIHADDAARALDHLLHLEALESIYIGVDEEPARRSEVMAWLRQQLDATAPRSPEGNSAASGKRCDSRALRESGFEFRFPTFREGYSALLAGLTAPGSHSDSH
ncbi:MAG: NAD-dependent epimerase/dehydratase family protein [Acidobacteriota bacterium]|nr:NAD-dependent epimerase/dehydratase family protein [Acidobacteriota bacterium]